LPDSAEFTSFWDHSTTIKIALNFTNASLYALSDYGAKDSQKWGDVYFPCTLKISFGGKDYTYEDAGARMKGNTSRRTICDANGTITQSCHFKISFKATFDDAIYDADAGLKAFKHDWSTDAAGLAARKKRNFLGMEKIDLKYLPRNEDKTISQEIYCYDTFRSAGILAPHAQWAAVNLASASSQLDFFYEVIEDIDKVFLKRHFSKDEAKGDLYKCVWGTDSSGSWTGANLARDGAVAKVYDAAGMTNGTRTAKGRIGVEDNYTGYHPNYQLKTNDDGEASDFSKMVNYINALWNIRYRKSLQNALESLLDVSEFLKFEAVSYLLGNFDDQRMNANNYYLYFRPSDGKAIYIPYDWDWGLGADDANKNSLMAKITPLQTTDMNGSAITTNVYWDTFFASSDLAYSQSSYIASYEQAVKEGVAAGYLDIANYNALVAHVPTSLGTSDVASVTTYMAAKKETIANSLK
jgi:spore coat protein CotH